MGKHLILIFLSLFLFSCASRKVNIAKSELLIKTDSSFVEKRDSVSVVQNAISIKEDIDEVEIVPMDASKPLVIDGKTYFNATVRMRKVRKSTIDSSKTFSSKSSHKELVVRKDIKQKTYTKSVDKKANYFIYLWLLVIPVIGWLIKRFIL